VIQKTFRTVYQVQHKLKERKVRAETQENHGTNSGKISQNVHVHASITKGQQGSVEDRHL
jgi:hypothetical protein